MNTININLEPFTPDLKNQLYEGFRRNALARIGAHEIRDAIAFVARGDDGILVGTIVVEIFWGSLHIVYLFVEEANRGQGIGTRLLQQALEYGRGQHAAFAFLETMSYLNVSGFYEQMGFYLEFTRSGYTHNNSFHYMRKNLV